MLFDFPAEHWTHPRQRRRRLNSAELLPLVHAGVRFVDEVRQERARKATERKRRAD